jgi:hypothetical protein
MSATIFLTSATQPMGTKAPPSGAADHSHIRAMVLYLGAPGVLRAQVQPIARVHLLGI